MVPLCLQVRSKFLANFDWSVLFKNLKFEKAAASQLISCVVRTWKSGMPTSIIEKIFCLTWKYLSRLIRMFVLKDVIRNLVRNWLKWQELRVEEQWQGLTVGKNSLRWSAPWVGLFTMSPLCWYCVFALDARAFGRYLPARKENWHKVELWLSVQV